MDGGSSISIPVEFQSFSGVVSMLVRTFALSAICGLVVSVSAFANAVTKGDDLASAVKMDVWKLTCGAANVTGKAKVSDVDEDVPSADFSVLINKTNSGAAGSLKWDDLGVENDGVPSGNSSVGGSVFTITVSRIGGGGTDSYDLTGDCGGTTSATLTITQDQ